MSGKDDRWDDGPSTPDVVADLKRVEGLLRGYIAMTDTTRPVNPALLQALNLVMRVIERTDV